jgi:hypothetical protein
MGYPSLSRAVAAATAGCPSGQRERSVKPSAQPTLVRTQHLPPPAKTARLLRILALAGRFLLVTPCIKVCHCASIRCSVHGRIADGVRAGHAVGDTVGFPRTATDGPIKGPCPASRRGPAPSVARRPASPRRGRHRGGGKTSGAADRGLCCPGAGAGRSCTGEGARPGRLSQNVIHPSRPGGSESAQNDALMFVKGIGWLRWPVFLGLQGGIPDGYCWFADKTGMGRSRWSVQALMRSRPAGQG